MERRFPQLLSNEEIIYSICANHKKNLSGTFFITNLRVLWLSTDSSIEGQDVMILLPEFHIENDIQELEVLAEERYILCIMVGKRKMTFSFSGPQYFEAKKNLVTHLHKAKLSYRHLDQLAESKYKIQKLMDNPYLKDLFKELVL